MNSIWQNIKSNFKHGSSYTRLLYINIGFFLVAQFFIVPDFLINGSTVLEKTQMYLFSKDYLFLSSNIKQLLIKPWTILSYMFIHKDFFHILFNLIVLHFGSKLFLQYFTNKQLISTYILGGVFGGLIYILSFNIFPVFFTPPYLDSFAIGSSASVLAIFIAISTYKPQYKVNLMFIGNISIIYIAIFLVILDYISIPYENPGGHIAHLGGALFGYIYIILLKKGYDMSVNFYKIINLFNLNKKIKQKRSSKENDDFFRNKKSNKQKKINMILEKISKSGYDSLTKEEKELLFKESR